MNPQQGIHGQFAGLGFVADAPEAAEERFTLVGAGARSGSRA